MSEHKLRGETQTFTYLKLALDAEDQDGIRKMLAQAHAFHLTGPLIEQAQVFLLDQAALKRDEEIQTISFFLKRGIESRNRATLVEILGDSNSFFAASGKEFASNPASGPKFTII